MAEVNYNPRFLSFSQVANDSPNGVPENPDFHATPVPVEVGSEWPSPPVTLSFEEFIETIRAKSR